MSTDSEDEAYVDRSLPSSPARTTFFDESSAGPSRWAYGSVSDEHEAVLRHAAAAFDEDEGEGPGSGSGSGSAGQPSRDEAAPDAPEVRAWQSSFPGHDDDDDGEDDAAMYADEEEEDDIIELERPDLEGDIKIESDGDNDEDDTLREGTPGAWSGIRERQRYRRGQEAERGLEESEDEEGPDERQCRICFSGAEEEETMGRLISPCLCTGSMRYVHVQCINAWRGTGTNAKAFMECPQCKHRYTLRRTLISGLATSRPLLALLSSLVFILLTITVGHLLHRYLLGPSTPANLAASSSSSARKLVRRPWSIFDMLEEDWDEFDNGVIIVGGGAGGGTLIWDVVMASIDTFSAVAERFARARRRIGTDGGWIDWAIFALGVRFLLGIAVLGSLSFLSLLLSFSLFAPFQLANGLRGTGLLNTFNRRARAAGGGGARQGTRTPAGQIMIVIFVLVGAVNTLVQVYGVVRALTERGLKYVETQILEVNPEDRRRARRREAWWRTWWTQGRWATRAGWEEVRARLWVAARGGLGPVWENMWARGVEQPVLDMGERARVGG